MYLFFKWLHYVGAISWMAGILYLYRLLIYHAENKANADNDALLQVMERKLKNVITIPAMTITFIAGLGMVGFHIQNQTTAAIGGWFYVKFLVLLGLVASTIYAAVLVKRFKTPEAALPTSKQLRWLNEVPTLFLVIILAMAVWRPF